MRKICSKKCAQCLGVQCPNYFKPIKISLRRREEFNYGILHSRSPIFYADLIEKKKPMDSVDWFLVGFLPYVTLLLTLFGRL